MRGRIRVRSARPAAARRRPRVAALLAEYLDVVPATTRERHRQGVDAWAQWCSEQHVGVLSVRPAHLVRYLDEMLDAGLQASTVAGRLSILRGLYRYLVAAGHMPVDPTVAVRAPRVVKVARGTWLTPEESRALLAAADADEDVSVRALVWMYAMHGMRVSEPLGLDVGDVRVERGRVVVTMTRKGYAGARADFLLAQPVGDRLLAAVGDRTGGPALLNHGGGRIPAHTARHIVSSMAMRARITVPITPHVLRRTFVTLGRDAGISDRDIQASTGHRRPDMIDYYDRARDSVSRDGGDQLAAFLGVAADGPPAPVAGPSRPEQPEPPSGTQQRALARERGLVARRVAADRVDAVADLIDQGATLAQIAEQVGISQGRVQGIVRQYDLRGPRSLTTERREQIRELAAKGWASTAIAREVGVHSSTVLDLIHAHAMPWPRPDAPTPVARSVRRARALELLDSGASPRAIAADLGVTLGTVSRYLIGTDVRTNRHWTDAELEPVQDTSRTAMQVALMLGRSERAVYHARARLRAEGAASAG